MSPVHRASQGQALRQRHAHQRHVEDRAHGRAHGLAAVGIDAVADRAATPLAPTASTVRTMVPRLPGSRTPSSATHSASAETLLGRRRGGPALLEHTEHGLGIVLGGDLAEHRLGHLQALRARTLRPLEQLAMHPGRRAARLEHEHRGLPARVPRRDQHGGALGEEQARIAPRLAHLERADELHPIVLQAGDGARAAPRLRRSLHRSPTA